MCSCHSILEWLNLFSGVKLSIRLFCFIQVKQFSASVLEEDTQLYILEEWRENTLHSIIAKSVLHGGLIVKSVKAQSAQIHQ